MKHHRPPPPAADDLREGRCPFCRPGDPFPCETCGDTRIIKFPATWSLQEDAKLRELVESGRPWTFVATSLARPEAICRSRSAVLGIQSPRPEPQGFVVVKAGKGADARVVDIHNPVNVGGGS